MLETKGLHFKNDDTGYKKKLLEKLTAMFAQDNATKAGELALEHEGSVGLVCDPVFDDGWRGTLSGRQFHGAAAGES